MARFELFEHTADIGVRGFGKDLNEAFSETAKGMFEVITNVSDIEPLGEVEMNVTGTDIEDLLTRWLSELLFLVDLEKMLMSDFDISIDETSWTLTGRARGERFNSEKHEYKTEIKAVTQHMLKIGPSDEGEVLADEKYMVQVLLDI